MSLIASSADGHTLPFVKSTAATPTFSALEGRDWRDEGGMAWVLRVRRCEIAVGFLHEREEASWVESVEKRGRETWEVVVA